MKFSTDILAAMVYELFPEDPLNLKDKPIPSRPVPVMILTGFLGSGKTTLLNHILHASHGLRIAVLVNDFGELNIDSQMVVDVEGEDLISLENGCVCCTIRGDLLESVLNLFSRPEAPDYVVIEASGVSYPAEIAKTFLMPALREYLNVESILGMIDCANVLDLKGESAVLAVDQVSMSDIVLLNKTDLVDEDHLEAVREWVRKTVPMARMLETRYAEVPLEFLLGAGAFSPERLLEMEDGKEVHVHTLGELNHEHPEHTLIFHTWSYIDTAPLAFAALREVIYTLPQEIVRAKGWIYIADVPGQKCLFQLAGTRATLYFSGKWGREEPKTQLVFISTTPEIDTLDLRLRFESCGAGELSEDMLLSQADIVDWMLTQ